MRFSCSTIATLDINRIVIAITMQIQAVDSLGIQIGGIVGADESAPFGGVIPGVAVVQAGIVIVVITTVTDGVGVGDGGIGRARSNGAIAESIIEVSCYHGAVGVDDCLHIAQQVPLEVIAGGHTAGGMLHTDDRTFVVQEYDPFGCGSGALDGFAGFFRNQTARMVVIILLVVSGYQPSLCRACQIRVGLCYPLAETVVGVGMALGAAGQPGQLTLAPCGGHAVIAGRTAHGVVGNAAAAEAGQLVRTVAKGSGSIAAAGGGVQGIVVGLNAGQVANIIIRINKGFARA